ncbi:MAG: nucleotidyltransferase substrate binding protein [Saprospiraceae bacterium]|nr:nucleotidyltransferase substrate binding protein [Saprospiraceae bacterium]
MMQTRWVQRFGHFQDAFLQLDQAVALSKQRPLSNLEKQGLIQAFEFTHELAWKVLKDFLFYQGNSEISGSRDATREAFSMGIIQDGHGWMAMIRSRNETSHTYNEATAEEIVERIIHAYHGLFHQFRQEMERRSREMTTG